MTNPAIPVTGGPARIGPVEAFRHGLVLAERSALKVRRDPAQFVNVVIGPVATLIVFLYTLGCSVAGSASAYLRLLVPGLMVQNVLLATMFAGVALNMGATKNVFDQFRSMPIGPSAPLVGAVLATTVRYVTATGVLLVGATILGFRVRTGVLPLTAGLVLLVGTGLCCVGCRCSSACWPRSPGSVQAILVALAMPLLFGSNVFVPIASLPGWRGVWADISPVSLLTSALRGLLSGGPSPRRWRLAWPGWSAWWRSSSR